MAQKKENKRKSSARPAHLRRSSAVKSSKDKEKNDEICISLLRAFWLFCNPVYQYGGYEEGKGVRGGKACRTGSTGGERSGALAAGRCPWIDVQLLTPNAYSRPQIAIENVNYIAIHYTANPGATAQANRNYFENLATTQETKVSSHFVVGLEGEVVQCIPTSEMSYATNARNVDTVSIECCHMDETGAFETATYDSVVKLSAWLCTRFGLTEENVIRHYDVTGKIVRNIMWRIPWRGSR